MYLYSIASLSVIQANISSEGDHFVLLTRKSITEVLRDIRDRRDDGYNKRGITSFLNRGIITTYDSGEMETRREPKQGSQMDTCMS